MADQGSLTGQTDATCANCGKPICRSDLTMQGPAGPWIHEERRTRRCWPADEYYAAPMSQRVSRG